MNTIQRIYSEYAQIKFALQVEQTRTQMSDEDFIKVRNVYKNSLSALLTSIDNVQKLQGKDKKLQVLRERIKQTKNELNKCACIADFVIFDL